MKQFNVMIQPYLRIYVGYVAVEELLGLPNINKEMVRHCGQDLHEFID